LEGKITDLLFQFCVSVDWSINMGRNIILLSDGTGNSAAKVWRTNVWRLFQSLDLKGSDQIAIYDDGVGTSSFLPLAILGGVFGVGLQRNVIAIYKFLCRNYQPGDKIYGFGFSRGAFTIRVVTGLVLNQGLVNFASEAELDKKAAAAYRAYRHAKYRVWNLQFLFRWPQSKLDQRFYKPCERPVESIEFLGLWDTVAAYGLPIDEMTKGVDRWIWPLELPNKEFNQKILKARHALAIDDERQTFHPVLWDEDATNTRPAGLSRPTEDERLLQVWFTGMHANVGGGYPDDSLANVSLSWILAEARQAGLVFKEMAKAEPDALLTTDSAKDKDGRLYDSRSGLGGYYRYSPRKISEYYDGMRKAAKKSGNPVGTLVPKIHESVFGRIQVGAHLYAPIGLPASYEVVTTGNAGVVFDPVPPAVTPDPLTISPNSTAVAEGPNAPTRHATQESAWDLVWRKRVVYFLTVFTTGYLLTYPLFRDSYAFQALHTRLRLATDTINTIGGWLPGYATRWPDAYARDPALFLICVAIVVLLTRLSTSLGGSITDSMRDLWVKYLPGTNKPPVTGGAKFGLPIGKTSAVVLACIAIYPFLDGLLSEWAPGDIVDSLSVYTAPPVCYVIGLLLIACALPAALVRMLRRSAWYQGLLWFFKHKLAPLLSAIGILLLVGGFICHFTFNIFDSFGYFCRETLNENQAGHKVTLTFDTGPNVVHLPSDRCVSTGVYVKARARYRIAVTRASEQWTFFGEPSYMGGQPISRLPWYKELTMAALYPLRRTLDRPWGAFILRIGGKGSEEDFLDRSRPKESDDIRSSSEYLAIPADGEPEKLGEILTPTRDGELFMYLNKPIIRWLGNLIGNTGTATVTIEPL
jgi:uncharacterized protein (DUF2235 family)